MLETMEKGRILIVSDSLKIQKYMFESLGILGYEVVIAPSKEYTIYSLNSLNPNVILLDFKMRNAAGVRIFEWMSSKEKWRSTPLIVLSEEPEITRYINRFSFEFIETVSEPFQLLVLNKRIESLLKQWLMWQEIERMNTEVYANKKILKNIHFQ